MPENLNPEAVDPEVLDRLREAVAEEIGDDVYTCSRVWEAWHYGTMTDEDFAPAREDDVLLTGIVQAVLAALPSPRPGTLIKTAEELDQLHEGAYVEDMYGDRGVIFNEHIWYPETKPLLLNFALKHYGPFTVLWVPTEGGRE